MKDPRVGYSWNDSDGVTHNVGDFWYSHYVIPQGGVLLAYAAAWALGGLLAAEAVRAFACCALLKAALDHGAE